MTGLGALAAVAIGAVIVALATPLTLVFVALFNTLGFDPVVRFLAQRIGRGKAVAVVGVGFVILVVLLVWVLVPVIIAQIEQFVTLAPRSFDEIAAQSWFLDVDRATGGVASQLLDGIENGARNPSVWMDVGGGVLQAGRGIVGGVSSTIFVVILALYFMASLEHIKSGFYQLVPRTRRAGFVEITEEIFQSVGKYLSGMVVLAFCNAIFSLIVMLITGVKFSVILAVMAFFITLIPLVGSLISTAIITFCALFTSPTTAIIVGLALVAYMQIEAYVLTPRIVGKSVSIPGSVVLIGAMVGATLAGLLGALVAFPIAAAVLLIVKKVVIPAQELR